MSNECRRSWGLLEMRVQPANPLSQQAAASVGLKDGLILVKETAGGLTFPWCQEVVEIQGSASSPGSLEMKYLHACLAFTETSIQADGREGSTAVCTTSKYILNG